MRFAILGDHSDGVAVARAVAASGRHQLVVCCGPPAADLAGVRATRDLEEVLADPDVEAVIVAGRPGERLDQLRRVLQSERPALCVHPVDRNADGAYEMNMLQGDTHQVVAPILPLAANRGVAEFADQVRASGPLQLVEAEFHAAAEALFDGGDDGEPHFPGWEVLRAVGGTIAEVQAFARDEAVRRGEPVTVQGRFESGVLFRAVYLSRHSEPGLKLTARTATGDTWRHEASVRPEDWAELVDRFGSAVARMRGTPRAAPGAGPAADAGPGPSWLDEIRAAELDDATRRSIERRRAVTLDYQEANEDVGFKGTMTLVGCGLIWLIPLFLLLSVWLPHVGWLIIPVLLGFLLLQLLRWFVPGPANPTQPP